MKAENRRRILQVVLTLLTLLLIGWIFSNSLKTASESSSQSSKVRGWIQTFFDALFPGGGIEVSGHIIRKVAHFSEYALLGLMLYLTYRAYTAKKLWLWIPALIGLVVPFCDEGLQFFFGGQSSRADRRRDRRFGRGVRHALRLGRGLCRLRDCPQAVAQTRRKKRLNT